jgi:hypothetical protein
VTGRLWLRKALRRWGDLPHALASATDLLATPGQPLNESRNLFGDGLRDALDVQSVGEA